MKVGIIGIGSIGEYYVRDLKKYNVEIVTCINSNYKSTKARCKNINKKYQTNISPAKNISHFFNKKFEIVIILCPNHLHLKYILYSIKKNKSVLVEKPLFDLNKINLSTFNQIIKKFSKLDKNYIFCNLSNNIYADYYKKIFNKSLSIRKEFIFRYNTMGNHQFNDIYIDILPHFFSIFDNLYKYKKITNINKKIQKDNVFISFFADKCKCKIYLRQSSKYKKLEFGFEQDIVRRAQIIKNNKLQTFLVDKISKKQIFVPNPLSKSLRKFIDLNTKKIKKNQITNNGIENIIKLSKIHYDL